MARLTELERVLRRDNEGSVRDALLAQLQAGEEKIQQQLRASQNEQQRQQNTLLLQACGQSAQVIATLWGRYHPAIA